MRYTISSILVILPILLSAQHYNIYGKVLDKVTQKPIPVAIVFISNTTKGCLTDSSGNFMINQVEEANFNLVVLHKNYETQVLFFTSHLQNKKIRFELEAKPKSDSLLKAVKSVNNDSSKLLSAFLAAFKGSSPNADQCNIVNPQVLRLQYAPTFKVWSVTSTEPLQVFNESLGYKVVCQIDECYLSTSYKMLLCNVFSWYLESSSGHKEIVAKWKENRALTYQGSLLHFMQAFYAGKLAQEGFTIRTVKRVYEQKDRETYQKELKISGNISGWQTDSAGTTDARLYFVDVVNKSVIPINKLRIVDTTHQNIVFSYSPDRLQVQFRFPIPLYGSASPSWNPFSYIQMLNHKDIHVEFDGMYFDPSDIAITGYWDWMKMADQLPYDYVLPDK